MKISEIKKEAKQNLKGKWGKTILITFIFELITIALGFVLGLTSNTFMYLPIYLAYLVLIVPISYGLMNSFVNLYDGKEVKAFDFLDFGFKNFKRSWSISLNILLKLLPLIAVMIVLIIATIAINYFSPSHEFNILVYIVLIALNIALLIQSFSYVASIFISFKYPNLTGKQCVELSSKSMNGKRGKYFGLILSFIGWILLGFLITLIFIFILAFIITMLFSIGNSLTTNSLIVITALISLITIIITYIFCFILYMFLTPYIQFSQIVFFDKELHDTIKERID